MIGPLLFAVATPSIADSLIRTMLFTISRGEGSPRELDPIGHLVILIPAREEGESLRPTLRSIADAMAALRNSGEAERDVQVIVILDGADPVAESVAKEFGAELLLKEPAGPTKGTALAWASADLPRDAEVVLLLDVGSRVEEEFFQKFYWKRGSDAMQTLISGHGIGAGEAAAASERVAQLGEDGGRERLGWAVRLRGTGMAFRPEVFANVASRLRTQVEDLESSLLLASEGRVLTMSGARILDEKPDEMSQAAVQRGRWLAGKFQVLSHHPDAMLKLISRNPAEGVAFAAEVLGRPLALSAVLRCAAAAALIAESRSGWRAVLAGVALGTVAMDVAIHARHGASAGSGMKILGAWAGAVALVPRSLARWMKARRP